MAQPRRPPDNESPRASIIAQRAADNVSLEISADVRIFDGRHEDLASGTTLPFRYIDKLGTGASAVVDVVEDMAHGRKYAHKVFRTYSGHDKFFKVAFRNEVQIIKRLGSNPHTIEVHWSYTRGRELGMLLTPVASDKDLGTYLLSIQDSGEPPTSEQEETLYRAFGCLVTGLAYIHSHTIRHKDIKPQNILVHHGRMVYTDFGIALDASNQSTTTTTGMPEAFTKRYCAPEVANSLPRNRMSDVFSLACVFLEIIAVLIPTADVGVTDPRPYCTRVDEIRRNFASLVQRETNASAISLLAVCSGVICAESADRLSTGAMREELARPHMPPERYFCSDCILVAPMIDENAVPISGADVLTEEVAETSRGRNQQIDHAMSSPSPTLPEISSSSNEQVRTGGRDAQDETKRGWCWDFCPTYQMPRKTLENFLKGQFGNYNFYIQVTNYDTWKFWIPRLLNDRETEELADLRTYDADDWDIFLSRKGND